MPKLHSKLLDVHEEQPVRQLELGFSPIEWARTPPPPWGESPPRSLAAADRLSLASHSGRAPTCSDSSGQLLQSLFNLFPRGCKVQPNVLRTVRDEHLSPFEDQARLFEKEPGQIDGVIEIGT